MARIAGVDLPREKRIEIALTYIYGIGRTTADEIIASTGINPDTRVKDLSENEISALRDYIDHHLKVEGDLRREERPHPQGPQEAGRRQEKGQVIVDARNLGRKNRYGKAEAEKGHPQAS